MPGLREPSHWLILIIVLVVVFGATRLPTIAKSIGQSMKVFKKEMKDLREDDKPRTDGPQPMDIGHSEPSNADKSGDGRGSDSPNSRG